MKATTERGDREGSVGGSVVHVPNAAFAMMPPEPMGSERPSYYYTMKTSGLSPGSSHAHARSHSRSTSQSLFSNKQTSTPISSPRAPHSVGQSYAPKLSPGAHRAGAQDTRTPSPNYFGLTVEPSLDPRDTSQLPRGNWSPPTSSVKSFAAVIPKQLPLDANPEFEAFRRQADTNRGKSGFGLSTAHFGVAAGTSHTPHASTPSALQRPRPPRWHTHGSDVSDTSQPRLLGLLGGNPRAKDCQSNKSNAETESLQDSAYGSADSKRNSEASLNPPPFFATGRQESPNPTESPFPAPERGRTSQPVPHPDTHQRLFSAQGRMGLSPLSEPERQQPRAETLPPKLESGEPAMIAPSQLKDLLKGGQDESVLLLDLRVSPQYAQSRVKGALNLCIPTTLLKRATFNLQKLQQIFQADRDQEKFASWRGSSHLVVYDASSSEKRDAVSAMNMIKKFTNEGYSGSACILRGGFNAFAAAYPELIDRTSGQAVPGFSLGSGPAAGQRPQVAPVVGGVLLPAATSNPNPFFSNIRQNQDLVDGVGQMDISLPSGLDSSRLPRWLRDAADVKDHGKRVSDKFLRIELAEQSRMRDAYTVPTPGGQTKNPQNESKVQLSGIEQGGKNRYKDILPFEHARVRLLGRPEGVCDYVNASHLQANRSHKRYIASQGPLPATFEDFWTVIWDQDVRVIVMLTAESEGGQLKCHPYWKAKDFGAIKLRVLSEKKVSLDIDKRRSDSTASPSHSQVPGGPADPSMASNQDKSTTTPSQAEAGRRRANTVTTFQSGTTGSSQTGSPEETPYVIIRKFALTHAAHPFSPIREVTQLHYPSWPDLGAPAQPSHLLALVELANVMQRATLPVDIPAAIATSSPAKISGHANPDRTGANSRRLHQSTGEQAVPLSWHDAPVSKENSRPMLVHCSAGCGRTGAFCTVDSVIDMLKRQRLRAVQRANKRIDDRGRRLPQQVNDHGRAKRQALERDVDGDISMVESVDPLSPPVNVATPPPEVSTRPEIDREKAPDDGEDIDLTWLDDDNIDLISRTVEDFRGQRLSMVQSLRQFVLCYETIIEWVWRLQERTGSSHIKGRGRSGSLAM